MEWIYIAMDILIVVLVLSLIGIFLRLAKRNKKKRYNVQRNADRFKNKELYTEVEKEEKNTSHYEVGEYYPATNDYRRSTPKKTFKNIKSKIRDDNDVLAQRLNAQAERMMVRQAMIQNSQFNDMN